MRSKSIYIIVLGVVALGAIIAAVVAGDRGTSIAVSGLIAIAAACVGALATLAHDFRQYEEDEEFPPPGYGWQEQTTQQRPPEGK